MLVSPTCRVPGQPALRGRLTLATTAPLKSTTAAPQRLAMSKAIPASPILRSPSRRLRRWTSKVASRVTI